MATSPGPTTDAYTERFIAQANSPINHDGDRDPYCDRITANPELARRVGMYFRTYVDSTVTQAAYDQRKKDMDADRAVLETAINGLEASANILRGDYARLRIFGPHPETVVGFHIWATRFQDVLPGVDEMHDVRRHGRFLDTSFLDYAQRETERLLGEPMSYETLARLVNAAMVADAPNQHFGDLEANPDRDSVTADSLRKVLERFRANNPNWNSSGHSTP
jgi:hypothetical protein